jgi:hypothetical protein
MHQDLPHFYPYESGHVFDQMVAGSDTLFALKTSHTQEFSHQLATYQDFTGRAAYHWHNNSGLKRFDLPHILLPRTNQLIDAIYHVANCQHFGIFLFTGFQDQLHRPMMLNVLDSFVRSSQVVKKFMIFADPTMQIPTELVDRFHALQFQPIKSNKPNLVLGTMPE